MDIYDYAEGINTKEDFEQFLKLLIQDLNDGESEWENNSLESFLDALYRFTKSIDEFYKNMDQDTDVSIPTWPMLAKMFLAAKVYE